MQYKEYDELPPGYYDVAETRGNAVQKFWHRRRFRQLVEGLDLRGRRVLDVGCGCGNFLIRICDETEFCVGIDAAPTQIEYANLKFKNEKTAFMTAKADSIPYPDEHFDLIFCSELIEHLDNNEEVLKEMKRVLRKGGQIVLTTPNYSSFWPLLEWAWNKASKVDYYHQHITHFNKKKLKDLLDEQGFETKITTFYILSPFLAIISEKLADAVMRIEQKILPNQGMLLKSVSQS